MKKLTAGQEAVLGIIDQTRGSGAFNHISINTGRRSGKDLMISEYVARRVPMLSMESILCVSPSQQMSQMLCAKMIDHLSSAEIEVANKSFLSIGVGNDVLIRFQSSSFVTPGLKFDTIICNDLLDRLSLDSDVFTIDFFSVKRAKDGWGKELAVSINAEDIRP